MPSTVRPDVATILADRVFNANQFGESRLHVCPLVSMSIFHWRMLFPVIFARGKQRASFVRFRGEGCRHPPQKSTGSRRRSGQRHHRKSEACSAVRTIPRGARPFRDYPISGYLRACQNRRIWTHSRRILRPRDARFRSRPTPSDLQSRQLASTGPSVHRDAFQAMAQARDDTRSRRKDIAD